MNLFRISNSECRIELVEAAGVEPASGNLR